LRESVVEIDPSLETIKQLTRTSDSPSCSATSSIALSSRCLAPPIHPSLLLLSLSFSSFRGFSIFRRRRFSRQRREKKKERGNINKQEKRLFICSSHSFGFLSPVSLSLSGLRPRTNREQKEREREFVTPRSLLVFFLFFVRVSKNAGNEMQRYELVVFAFFRVLHFSRLFVSSSKIKNFLSLSFTHQRTRRRRRRRSIRFD